MHPAHNNDSTNSSPPAKKSAKTAYTSTTSKTIPRPLRAAPSFDSPATPSPLQHIRRRGQHPLDILHVDYTTVKQATLAFQQMLQRLTTAPRPLATKNRRLPCSGRLFL
jgi:hypothetical protein